MLGNFHDIPEALQSHLYHIPIYYREKIASAQVRKSALYFAIKLFDCGLKINYIPYYVEKILKIIKKYYII